MLKNIKIRTRMLLSYAVIILLGLSASVAALIMMDQISGNLTVFYENNYAVTVKAWTAKREMQYARADILKGILETDDDDMQTALDQASAALANMRAAFPVIRERFKGDMALMDEVDSILVKAVVYRDQVFDLVEAKKNEEAFALMKASYIPLLDQISDTLDKISGQAERNAKEKVDQGKQLQRIFMLVVIGIIVLNIILAALLALHISNGIRRPVEEIRTAAEKLASGNLDVSIDYYAEDELGNLSDSIRSLIHIFQGIIGDMGYGLAAVGSGDFTVDSKAEELYAVSYTQLFQTEQTSHIRNRIRRYFFWRHSMQRLNQNAVLSSKTQEPALRPRAEPEWTALELAMPHHTKKPFTAWKLFRSCSQSVEYCELDLRLP